MKKQKKRIFFLGSIAAALAVALVITSATGVFAKNINEEISGYENKGITDLITAYDNEGKEINPEKVDSSMYQGYMFRLKDSAPDTFHSKGVLKEFDGQISYNESSGVYKADSLETIDAFADEKYIESIEPDYTVEVSDNSPTPNDKYYSSHQWNLPMMNVPGAWENKLYGQYWDRNQQGHVTVAVVDSGVYGSGGSQVDAPHEDINYDHILKGVNLMDSQEGTPDTLGHGTFITGLIAADQNNEKGVAGIMPEVDILPIRIFGSTGRTSTSTVVEGIYKAIEADVDVINLSLGSEGSSSEMKTACETAVEKGILVVAAAGNDGTRVNNYPAAYDCVIGVASLDEDGQPSYFSQYGDSVYVAAPGGKVTSVLNEQNKYVTGSGTSYACPEVVALGAMARSIFPDMNQNEFMQLLQETCQDKGDEGFDIYYGWGLVDFKAAAEYLLEKAYVPIYHLSFDINDQDGEDLDGVNIRVEAAQDIEWEDDEEAGIKAGKWEKGHVVEPEKDGEYAGTYSLHKGKYRYILEKEGYWSKESGLTTYSENQSEKTYLEKTYDVSLDIIDSEKDKLDGAEVSLTRTSDDLSTEITQSEDGAYRTQLPEGTYKYNVQVKGYEPEAAYITVKRQALEETVMVHTGGEVSIVDFACISGTEEEPGEAVSDVTVTVKDSEGNRIPAVSDGRYQLVRGGRYTYTAVRAGYEDEIGKIKVGNSGTQTVTVYMQPSTLYAVIKAVDRDGNELEDADVIIRDKDGRDVSPVKTDNSRYNLERGIYSYTVNCDGYTTETGGFEMSRTDSYREIKVLMSKVTAKVEITVSDEDGAVISDADTAVFDRKGDLCRQSSDGSWKLAEGRHTYTVYKDGYGAASGSFTMDGKSQQVKVTLKQSSGETGEFSGGSGTAEDPYLISTEAQLRAVSEKTKINFGNNAASRTVKVTDCYRLVCDIELEDGDWEPVGNYQNSGNYAIYKGTFDGAGHTVSGVSVTRKGTMGNGFFGVVEGATIKNLTVRGNVNSGKYTGGIAGLAMYNAKETLTISDCQFIGNVRGTGYVGGIAGSTSSSSVGTSDKVNVFIDGCSHSGGRVWAVGADGTYGEKDGSGSDSRNEMAGGILGEGIAVKVTSCYNTGDVTAGYQVGGIAGMMETNTYIYNAYNTGDVLSRGTSTYYTYKGAKGGVVGNLYGTALKCYYLKDSSHNTGVTAGFGQKQAGSTSEKEPVKTQSEMKAAGFAETLNLVEDVSRNAFVATDSYPVLSWQTAVTEKYSAQKPVITEDITGASYELNDKDVKALRVKVDAVSDGGTLTYQWYRNDIADRSMAEKIDGASGTLDASGITEYTPAADEAGETYYHVVITNTVKAGADGKTSRSRAVSSIAKITVKSTVTAAAPEISSVSIVGKDGKPASEDGSAVTTGSYDMGSKVEDTIKVDAKSTDGGELTYQWYASKYPDGKGAPVKGQTSAVCEISTEEAGTLYYYVAVTNTRDIGNGQTDAVKKKSDRVAITVVDVDQIEADKVAEMVDEIGDVTLENASKVLEARAAYDRLSDNAKAKVTNLNKLEAAEKALAELNAKLAAANEVSNQISAIGTVTLDKEDQIKAARAAYDALEDDVKAMVEGLDTLEKAEKTLENLKADAAAASEVSKKIGAIGTVTLDKEAQIKEARAAYDALSDAGKTMVTGLDKLTAAEKKLTELKKDAARPAAVTGVKAAKAGYDSVKITWSKSSGAEGYEIQRSTKQSSGFKTAGTVNGAKTVTFTDKKLATGTTYYYKVRAVSSYEGSSVCSSWSAVKSAKPSLSKTTVSLKAGKKKATVSWKKVSGASGYKIYRSTKKSSGYKCVKTITKGSTVKYTNKSLKSKKTYYYKVRAYRTVSGKKVYSSYSAAKSVRTK